MRGNGWVTRNYKVLSRQPIINMDSKQSMHTIFIQYIGFCWLLTSTVNTELIHTHNQSNELCVCRHFSSISGRPEHRISLTSIDEHAIRIIRKNSVILHHVAVVYVRFTYDQFLSLFICSGGFGEVSYSRLMMLFHSYRNCAVSFVAIKDWPTMSKV